MDLILFVLLVFVLIILAEIAVYCWHRLGAHHDYLTSLFHQNHRVHHSNDSDNGSSDFIYILPFILALTVALLILWYWDYLSSVLFWTILIVVVAVYLCNWYIHCQYHEESSWLNRFEWFRHNKEFHLKHHADPTVNYSIITTFCDEICGTWS